MRPTLLAVFMVWRMWVDYTLPTAPWIKHDLMPTALLYERSWECHAAKVGETLAAPPVGYREPECRPEALEVKP